MLITALPSWFPARLPPLPRVVSGANILLIIGIGFSAAQLTWLLWPNAGTHGAALSHLTTMPTTTSINRRGPRVEEVAGLHLFGKAAGKPEVVSTENVPETQLKLTLRGIFAAYDQGEAFAIITNAGGNDQHYKVGEQIFGEVIVKEIHPDHVLLSRGGHLETLRLPKKSAGFGSKNTRLPPSIKGGSAGRRPSVAGPVSQQLQGYRDRILSNPMEAMDLVQMQPVTEGGKLKGYRLSPRRDRQLFRQAGLRPGDVVTSVNGIALSDPASMGQVMSLLSTANSFNLVVERGGREENIFVDLNN